MMKRIYTLLFFIFLSVKSFSFSISADSTQRKKNLPVISFAQGILYFLGDVGYTHLNEPFFYKSGFQLELQKHTTNRLSFSLFILSGRVFGEEKSLTRNLNFLSSIVAEGISLRYDFTNHKIPKQIITPFISFGVEYIIYHNKGDLKDANGNIYNYWNDGTIRNIAEGDSNASGAQIIHRDFNYETDLRDADIDGIGKYRQSTIGFPVGVGFRFRLSGRCSMHFSTVVHFTSGDLIDNINNESEGTREGNGVNDKIIFPSVSFRYDMSAPREVKKKNKIKYNEGDFKNVDFNSLTVADADHDGIPDIDDVVIDSTANGKVDKDGRPIDSDDDGIPDYRDKELESKKDAVVNEDGETITEEMIEEKFRKDSLAALPAIVEYLHFVDKHNKRQQQNGDDKNISSPDTSTLFSSRKKTIPKIFRPIDTDINGVINPSEISAAIDEYLEGKSPYDTTQFYQLVDFFFGQE